MNAPAAFGLGVETKAGMLDAVHLAHKRAGVDASLGPRMLRRRYG